jgi:transcriptional regulator with XRE-family HTH domain
MDIRRRLGLNVQRLRRDKGWSQEDLAFESGLHRTYISGIERGIRNPTVTIIDTLAITLDVAAGDLLNPPLKRPAKRRKA